MFKADGKGKKRKIESKSKELSGKKKRCKLDSESTEKKEDTVDGGENDSEIAEGMIKTQFCTVVAVIFEQM